LLAGFAVALLDARREFLFLLGGQERDFADVVEIGFERGFTNDGSASWLLAGL